MFEFLLATENLPFTIALGVMVLLGLLEGVTTVLGMGASSFLDAVLPDVDIDADLDINTFDLTTADGDLDLGDVASHGPVAKLMGWMHIGRVPVLILLALFLFAFGMAGLFVQMFAEGLTGMLLPAVLAVVPAFIAAMFVVHYTGMLLAKIIPKDETSAVGVDSFVGRVAQITLGTARRGSPAQAKLRDQHGQTHYVMVEPDSDDAVFDQGIHVLLVKRDGPRFLAIENPSNALVDQETTT
ncbi:YqiJ family protein [Phycisphaerales bacterium AB-hyl4]|uniref:YqiJ family protein n=1 Tax=Natronomicrosphaera hydrolytica TaxID=3242702 RepID=A0ABV4UBL7_9BACT